MKLSICHSAKMIKKSLSDMYICSACWYASWSKEVSAKDYTKKSSHLYPNASIYSPKKKKDEKTEPYPITKF